MVQSPRIRQIKSSRGSATLKKYKENLPRKTLRRSLTGYFGDTEGASYSILVLARIQFLAFELG